MRDVCQTKEDDVGERERERERERESEATASQPPTNQPHVLVYVSPLYIAVCVHIMCQHVLEKLPKSRLTVYKASEQYILLL